jgi:hypothetical protein
MLNRLADLGKEQWLTMFQMMKDNFLQKHVLIYSSEESVQAKISQMGFDGKILDAPHDYLAIINSNHGGTKTDLDVEQSVNYKSEISENGTITNTVTITRHNTASLPNRNFMRVLVPLNSVLTESDGFLDKQQLPSQAEGFDTDPLLADWDKGEQKGNVFIRTEAGKTEFTGWLETAGKSASVVTLKYVLPTAIKVNLLHPSQSHSLIFQKQLGNQGTSIEGQWIFPDRHSKWFSANTSQNSEDSVSFTGLGKTDESWGIILTR